MDTVYRLECNSYCCSTSSYFASFAVIFHLHTKNLPHVSVTFPCKTVSNFPIICILLYVGAPNKMTNHYQKMTISLLDQKNHNECHFVQQATA